MKVGMDCFTYAKRFRTGEWTVWDYLRRAEELNLDGVHLAKADIERNKDPGMVKEEYAKVKKFCDDHGWEKVAAGGNQYFATKNTERCLDELKSELEAAKFLGAKAIKVFPGGFGNFPEARRPSVEWARRPLVEWTVRSIRKAVELAETYDCVLGMEVPHQALYYPADGLEVLDRVDSKYLGVTLDTGNLYSYVDPHLPPVKAVELLALKVVATHVRDYDYSPEENKYYCVPCGEGFVDLPAIATILKMPATKELWPLNSLR